MTTMTTLAATVADLADWLHIHDHPDLPPPVSTSIDRDYGRARVRFQLPSAGFAPVLQDLADWAEYLATTVTLELDVGSNQVHASITTTLRHGQPVELWNYLEFPQMRALHAAGITVDDSDPVTVTPTTLRTADTGGTTR